MMDLSSLKPLRLHLYSDKPNNARDTIADLPLLAKLEHLTNLEEFYLDQGISDRASQC